MKLSSEVYSLQSEVSEMKNPITAQYVRFHDPSRETIFTTNAAQSPAAEMSSAR